MKKLSLVILLSAMVIVAFARQHKHKKKAALTNHIVSVSLRHTACYGRCPIYTLELNRNGMATYTATLFNPDTGVFTKDIGVTKAMEIINQFNNYRIDTCKDMYNSRHTDLPGTIFTIKYDTTTKTIMDASAGPPFFEQLRALMDGLITKKIDNSWHRVPEKQK